MAKTKVRCTVVEVGCDDATARSMHGSRRTLPWQDPFISQIVTKYRLRAALADSLQFLQSEASQQALEPRADEVQLPLRTRRFDVPTDQQSDSSFWSE